MNVPAVAKKSFDELNQDPEFLQIVQIVLKKLQKLPNYFKRTKFIHRLVDEFNEEIFSSSIVQELSPCKQGCSGCCHTQVSVTEDEAQLLIQRINEGVDIDQERLKMQLQAGDDSAEFFKLSYSDRRCIFLDESGSCTVYKDRPSVCRTNAVLGESAQCDTSETIKPQRLVRTPKSDMVIYASFLFGKRNGSLPVMIGRILKENN